MSVKNGYTIPQAPPTDPDAKREYENNAKAKNAILSGLSNTEFVKVMHCTSAKTTWDKMQSIFEGDIKVKEAKPQNLRAQFENLKMRDEEKIADYLQKMDEIMGAIRELGEEVSAIEEVKDLKNFSMDELFGSLLAYEMRIIQGETSKREAAFNITKKGKEEGDHEEEVDSDAFIASFVRKFKRGSVKYKGKFPFKCFNYGKIEHFASKCPYGEKDEDEKQNIRSFGKDKIKKTYKPRRRSFRKKYSLYAFEDDAFDEESVSEDCCSEDEREVNLFMEQGELDDEKDGSDEEEEIEAEVDLEGEIVSALEELRKVRK
ncbi:uncharacterized protein LOC131875781 [Cryptomeria japonica]|uniref:uncharacterized protein LOC131875781 n=1 Tax=Cryptomeria japonica TaxID=3369 RepID=UPI0027DA9C86|nr:uncharacterized protein LOC131875781 [Cryptomeria japonica]